MPEEEKKEEQTPESQAGPETQGNPGAPESDGASTPEDLQVIKAELEEERKAKAAAEAALAEKDSLITDLQNQLTEAKQLSDALHEKGEAAATQLDQLREAHTHAVARYLDAVKLANPTLPGDVITGDTIEAIDASLQKATTIAGAVKASLEAQAKEAKVPAGAPPRGEISLDGLSPKEKIIAGIQQKQGGTS
jgi:ATP/maltotriose-dependent transcriptional regulator MalT